MMASRSSICAVTRNGVRRFNSRFFALRAASNNEKRGLHHLSPTVEGSESMKIKLHGDINSYKLRYHCLQNSMHRRGPQKFYRCYSTLPSHEKVKLPNLSPTMEVGTIVAWEKQEGDRIEEGEVLALIETDKSTMEMETPDEGYLAKILLPVGSKDVPVNQVIAIIVSEEEDILAFKDYTGEDSPPPTEQESKPSQTEQNVVTDDLPLVVPEVPLASPTARVFASPLAKRVALERGVDINIVPGTGPRGRITVEDVETHKAPAVSVTTPPSPVASIPQSPPPADALYSDIDLSNMRKTIAKRLTESKQTVPHYYLSVDVNMDEVMKLRQILNEGGDNRFKLSVNDFIVKAAALSLTKVPECNSQWMTDFIRQFHNVDISVAVSTDGGLITPIVANADKKGLQAINANIVELAEKARNKTIQPHEFMGGTFTISNLGMYGISNFSAVINPPQSCILAVGATQDRIIADKTSENGYASAKMMSVTLSCDHRVVDGAVGAQWLKTFRSYLEKPITMLL